MTLRDQRLLLSVTVGLVLTVTLVVWRLRSDSPATGHATTAVAPRAGDAAANVTTSAVRDASTTLDADPEWSLPSSAAAREPIPSTAVDSDTTFAGSSRRREGRKLETAFVAEFAQIQAEQGLDVLTRTVRETLASKEQPLSRKVAGLRVLQTAGVPDLDALLAGAVEHQLDVSDGRSPSVPRAALRILFERAPNVEDARRVLARLAFAPDAHVSADLRRNASAALAASMPSVRREDVLPLLSGETDAARRASAEEALARDANFDPRPPVPPAADAGTRRR